MSRRFRLPASRTKRQHISDVALGLTAVVFLAVVAGVALALLAMRLALIVKIGVPA
jgi:hypothetical protein